MEYNVPCTFLEVSYRVLYDLVPSVIISISEILWSLTNLEFWDKEV